MSAHLLLAALLVLSPAPEPSPPDPAVPERAGGGEALTPAAADGLPFPVRFADPVIAGVRGKPLEAGEEEEALARLASYALGYPRGFLASYVSEVYVLNDLSVDGILARGHRDERRLLLEFRGPRGHTLQKRDFDHEVFHALDGYLGEAPLGPGLEEERRRVLRLRDLWDEYRLTPSHRYSFSWEKAHEKPPWLAYVPVVGLLALLARSGDASPPPGFAYVHGAVTPREDRATVAEALLSGDEGFLRRAAGDRELREKVAIVREMYRVGSAGAIDASYWSDLVSGPAEVPSLAELESRLWPEAPELKRHEEQPGAPARKARERKDEGRPDGSGNRKKAEEAKRRKGSGKKGVEPSREEERGRERPPVVAVLEEPEAGAAAGEETGPEPGEAPEETGVDGGEAREITLARGRPAPPSPGGRSEPARSRGSVAAAPPAAAAAASPRARATARAYADGLAAFRARDYPRSAAAWREMLAGIEPDLATIQLALNCAFENVLKNQQALDGKASFYALPYRHQGKACHLSFTGLYRNREEAGLALAELPATVREEKPRVVTIGEARRRLEGQ